MTREIPSWKMMIQIAKYMRWYLNNNPGCEAKFSMSLGARTRQLYEEILADKVTDCCSALNLLYYNGKASKSACSELKKNLYLKMIETNKEGVLLFVENNLEQL